MFSYKCRNLITESHTVSGITASLKFHRGQKNHMLPEHLHARCKHSHEVVYTNAPCEYPNCAKPTDDFVTPWEEKVLNDLNATLVVDGEFTSSERR